MLRSSIRCWSDPHPPSASRRAPPSPAHARERGEKSPSPTKWEREGPVAQRREGEGSSSNEEVLAPLVPARHREDRRRRRILGRQHDRRLALEVLHGGGGQVDVLALLVELDGAPHH